MKLIPQKLEGRGYQSINQSVYLLTAANTKQKKRASLLLKEWMVRYNIPAHHTTETNLLKSTLFKRTLKEYSDGAVTMLFSKLFPTSIRFAKLKARQFTRLKFFRSFTE